jgi:hypothetical protein
MDTQSNNKNTGSAPQNLPREEGANVEKKQVQSTTTEVKADRKESAIKGLAVLGIIALILIGLYGSSRVLANLPEVARSIASGFVSVTSQFFGADGDEDDEEDEEDDDRENNVIVVERDEDSEDDESDEGGASDDEEVGDDTTPTTPTQPATPQYRYRVVQTPTSFGPPASDPNGDVDLEVSILATGIIHPQKKTFIEQDFMDINDRGAVRFQVKNIGTKTSEEWKYRVNLPTDPDHTYDSDEQMGLKPGERIEYTLQFDSLSESNNELEIEVDPGRRIDDVSRSNNRVEVDLDIRD